MEEIKKVGIIGVGLLGGSIGLALKERYPNISVIGMGRDENKLKKAIQLNAIDNYSTEYTDLYDCDIIVICTPIRSIAKIYCNIAAGLKANAIVTDVGSTKLDILEEIDKQFPDSRHFVGSHPMAGSEQAGVEYAKSDLYVGATVVVTDSKNKDNNKAIDLFWKSLGANTINLTAKEHDHLVAYTSHLPHLIASCLSYSIRSSLSEEDIQTRVYGNGLLDTTRISEGDPSIWLDIFMSNKKNVLSSIRDFKSKLELIENIINKTDEKELCDYLLIGKEFRKKLQE